MKNPSPQTWPDGTHVKFTAAAKKAMSSTRIIPLRTPGNGPDAVYTVGSTDDLPGVVLRETGERYATAWLRPAEDEFFEERGAWREDRGPKWSDDLGYLLQDALRAHHYDYSGHGSRPDDPGWHPCDCGWEGYWTGYEEHVIDHLRSVVAPSPHRDGPRRVVVESPYAGDVEINTAYARAAMRDCLERGEAPFASHLLYTQPDVLDDAVPTERGLGIEAGLAWGSLADATVVYTDLGITPGMEKGIDQARTEGRPVEVRTLSSFRPQNH